MSANRAGRVLGGRYTLVKLIATGGMGEVWKARDRNSGSIVAAKLLRPELIGEEISLSRLRIEAKNAMVARHPNIAAVLDSGEDQGQGWIIMELVESKTLTQYFIDGGRMSGQQIIPILIQTAYALDAAARAGIVHRDVKPANIMVRRDGKVKLTDFGVSHAAGQANLTAVGMVMGTAQYLAPEQALGKPATTLGDIYALGVIAYEALAGRRPYTGKSQVDIAFAHVNDPVPPLPEDVPEPLAAFVTRVLSKDPTERPQSGTAFARELTRVAGEIGAGTEPLPLEPAAPEPEPVSSDAPAVIAPVKRRVRPKAEQWGNSRRPGPVRPSEPEKPKIPYKMIAVALTIIAIIIIAIIVLQNVANAYPNVGSVSQVASHVTQEVTYG